MALALLLAGGWMVVSRDDTAVSTGAGARATGPTESARTSDTTAGIRLRHPVAAVRRSASSTRQGTTTSTRTAPPARRAGVPPGFDTITLDELPDEALDTIDLIERGGPFPYRADDETFQNRERLLPIEDLGYYREYTVETPGSPDRGARRIVAGEDGELYYTDDHYDSFRWVLT